VSLFADSIDLLEDASVNLLIFVALGWTMKARARLGMATRWRLDGSCDRDDLDRLGKGRIVAASSARPLSVTGLGVLYGEPRLCPRSGSLPIPQGQPNKGRVPVGKK